MLQENQELIKLLFTVLFAFLSIIILVIISIYFFSKKEIKFKNDLNELKNKQEKEILKAQLEIQEETFRKISREIHDNISLGLTLAKLQLNNAIISDSKDTDTLMATVDLISKSLVDLNDISKSLDAKQMVAHGLINALQSEVDVIKKSGLLEADLEMSGEPVYLDAETDLILLRIFQEACNNIIKHANAKKIDVDLYYKPGELLMKITDDGNGFDVDAVRSNKEIRKMSGLKNLETRAQLINATFEIISFPKVGTTINIKIPIKKNQDEK
jgi:two-component system, NarL family, sensor kinase